MMLFLKQYSNISTVSCVPKQLDPRSRAYMAGIEPLGEMDHSLGSSTHLPVVNGCALVFNSFLLHSLIEKIITLVP